jgi:K+-transporting ATPase KdpF subunit
MTFDYSLAALVAVGLLFYLTYALLRPERSEHARARPNPAGVCRDRDAAYRAAVRAVACQSFLKDSLL